MRRRFFLVLSLAIAHSAISQTNIAFDTTLQEITIQAYSIERALTNSPTSVAIVGSEDISRFAPSSILPSVNAIAGVRMEERSPGSYRFAIRGSAIRSPFGIRNVKVYYNGIPFTDAGGNTYLNLLETNAIGSLEIIKGPGGSMYGAGTGGVLLINSPAVTDTRVAYSGSIGSFSLLKNVLSTTFQSETLTGGVIVSDHRSDGYRDHAAMERKSVNTNLNIRVNEDHLLTATFLFTDLFYETPGGLTLEQFENDPKQARPSGTSQGAVEAQAAIFNKTFFSGITHEASWNENTSTFTSLYGASTDFANPSIREYEERDERNFGFRSVTNKTYANDNNTTTISAGIEGQFMESPVRKYENDGGDKTNLNSDDEYSSRLFSGFAQADFDFQKKWILTIGLSANHNVVRFNQYYPETIRAEKNFRVTLMPRVAMLRKIGAASVYASYSRGYSPPTFADLYPSGGTFNPQLDAEFGNNLEAGIKGARGKLNYEIAAYQFMMRNTIVRRVTTDDIEYFINAGKTNQRGIESTILWQAISDTNGVVSDLKLFASYTYNHYRFSDYELPSGEDVTGNKLTGVAPTTAFAGVDLAIKNTVYIKTSVHHTDHIPLDDLNTSFASPYTVVNLKGGFRRQVQKFELDVNAGVDNVLDQRYSLGHDLNAFGARYYNAAATINFYFGISLAYVFRK